MPEQYAYNLGRIGSVSARLNLGGGLPVYAVDTTAIGYLVG